MKMPKSLNYFCIVYFQNQKLSILTAFKFDFSIFVISHLAHYGRRLGICKFKQTSGHSNFYSAIKWLGNKK